MSGARWGRRIPRRVTDGKAGKGSEKGKEAVGREDLGCRDFHAKVLIKRVCSPLPLTAVPECRDGTLPSRAENLPGTSLGGQHEQPPEFKFLSAPKPPKAATYPPVAAFLI
jgi:hypothetical protein